MTSPIKAGKTPAKVANLATHSKGLDLNDLTLLGVFGPKDALTALIRMPGGRIKRIKAGDRLGTGVVLAIDMDGVMLSKFGQTQRLFLPG
jgi:Tfp pilus assembly protein PilP